VLGQAHDHRHVVLDHEQGQSAGLVGGFEAVDQILDQHRVDAGGRLIEQQHRGIVGERHGELEQLLLAEGEIAGKTVPLLGKAHKIEQLGGVGVHLAARPAKKPGEGRLSDGGRN
jgi:hypothetical protein